ncbi:asparaginase domain-containing protein [Salinisphaera sp. Q1T1-3]|uniref:asparaginase domain-containing protein n=1 Tax=Salinisphaera sp. Q1T1-3 TaxID=2321229 RepID=UPI00131430AF|nr:asparaginase domain-containing protein [Salinisphaera sp. Q1T1-3]
MAEISQSNALFRLTLLATGGTIEKTYDAHAGALTLDVPVIEDLLDTLWHPDIAIQVSRVMACDSLDMDDDDRRQILEAAREIIDADAADAVIVTHGTDTLPDTARVLARGLSPHRVPVVLTGAMRPYRVAESDARQNVAQAIMAARIAAPGVYGVCHGRMIAAEHIAKDAARLTFVDTRR